MAETSKTKRKHGRKIAIIGGGFSGSILAVHLLRRCEKGDLVYLVEKSERFGPGLAYATGNASHMLNVRAGNMSAFPEEPSQFVDWLKAHGELLPPETAIDENTFVPRGVYGSYIQSLIAEALKGADDSAMLSLIPDEAIGMKPQEKGYAVELLSGRPLKVDAVVLALGNQPPDTSLAGYFGNPWDPEAVGYIPPKAAVMILGTGLTMIDTVLSLRERGHNGPIFAFSRRGLLPRQHRAVRALPPAALDEWQGKSLSALLRQARTRIAALKAEGQDWRALIDSLRGITQPLWKGLSLADKQRFLRHLRPWWDVHRHRCAPQVWREIETALDSGQLLVRSARINAMKPSRVGIEVRYTRRGSQMENTLNVNRVINCSGPSRGYATTRDPLARALLDQGLMRPDELDLGVDVDAHGAVIDAQGQPANGLFAIGPMTQGTFWEIIAVPDIRNQCAEVAARLFAALAAK